jgi:hypothetical protein
MAVVMVMDTTAIHMVTTKVTGILTIVAQAVAPAIGDEMKE